MYSLTSLIHGTPLFHILFYFFTSNVLHQSHAAQVWAEAFFDKVFLLAEKREKPRKSDNRQGAINVGASVAETVDVFFAGD